MNMVEAVIHKNSTTVVTFMVDQKLNLSKLKFKSLSSTIGNINAV